MEKYNKYGESLYFDCNCKDNKQPKKIDNCSCGGINLPSHDNEIEVLIKQLKREVKNLMQTTEAKLLCQDKKIAETMVYIKNNLSNSLRDLLDSMIQSGELDDLITDTVLSDLQLLELRFEDVINVKELGEYGDGTHDDTLSIQRAINTHKIVLIPNGTYLISNTLTGTDKTHIYGEDRNNTTIKYTIEETSEKPMLIIGHRSVVKNITFMGPDNDNIDIDTYVNFKVNGIDLTGSSYNIIRNCRFMYLASGVLIHNSWCNLFENCYCGRCNKGFNSENGSHTNNLTFLNCQIEYNNVGASLGEGRTQTFYSCDIENNLTNGIQKTNEGDIQVINSYFEDKITIKYGSTYVSNVLISGCSFFQSPQTVDQAYIPINYSGDANQTKITVMNCNFKNVSAISETYNTVCIKQLNNANTIKPILINNTIYQMKEVDTSYFKGISISNGIIKDYNYKNYTYLNATNGQSTNLSLSNYNKYRVNLDSTGNHNIILPSVNDKNIYYEFDFIVPGLQPSNTTGKATITGATGVTVYGDDLEITLTDKNKLIKAVYIGYFNNVDNWEIVK